MKCTKLAIKIILLLSSANVFALPKHSLMLFIRDPLTNQVIYNSPLQANYAGYFTSSNHNGQIILPRKTQNSEFYILITPKILPVFDILNNISHLQVPKDQPASLYFIKKQINNNTGKSNWLTTLEVLSSDRHIPLHTIIISADPNDVSIPTGLSPLTVDNHLILPSIYLSRPLVNTIASTYLPNTRPFLGKTQTAYTLTPYGYATLQTR